MDNLNEYQKAAEYLKDYVQRDSIDLPEFSEKIMKAKEEFMERFAPEKLESLSDSELLRAMFYTKGDNTNSLCCWLEMNKDCREYFGGIAGGSAYKFGLFQRKDTGEWTTGSSQKPVALTEDEALAIGKEIRDVLVKGVYIICENPASSQETYEKLDDTLHAELGDRYALTWIHKYYSIVCSDKLSGFHSNDWQKHALYSLNILPSDKYYGRSGQISMIQNYAGWTYHYFIRVLRSRFGTPRSFIRLETLNENKSFAKEWSSHGVVAIGWSKLGDLSAYANDKGINRKKVQDKLEKEYYSYHKGTASRKAGEIVRFYNCDEDTVFILMEGDKLIAAADKVGNYYYNPASSMAHQRKAEWKNIFDEGSKLPDKSEGKLTSCYRFKNESNIRYLYEKFFYGDFEPIEPDNPTGGLLDEPPQVIPPGGEDNGSNGDAAIKYHTGYESHFERNRIVFGAPGTGKSYTVNKEAEELLGFGNECNYERVTFHPEYSYAHFIGTYKPVPVRDEDGRETITYSYVPGPFMRVYVNALRNSRTDVIKPFLLIIEEINRANVAAVFGDVFQLLDRDDKSVSEYPIQASEDVRSYLAKELGGEPDDYTRICIPDNMFIWATMNSADQGVFPMDTAFKRRWDFTYLGIDDNDTDLQGKYVYLGKDKNQRLEWNKLRKAINHFLAKEKINEDKQLGPYFLPRRIIVPEIGDEINQERFVRTFKNKVIMYLFEDAAKQRRSKLFEGCGSDSMRYSDICREFDEKGMGVFNREIQVEAEAEELQPITSAKES